MVMQRFQDRVSDPVTVVLRVSDDDSDPARAVLRTLEADSNPATAVLRPIWAASDPAVTGQAARLPRLVLPIAASADQAQTAARSSARPGKHAGATTSPSRPVAPVVHDPPVSTRSSNDRTCGSSIQ
jgi:hypothetical protein